MLYSHVTLLMLRVIDVVAKTTVQQSTRALVADISGDIQIGALFPMHHQITGAEGCGLIWEQYGIQRAEIAMLTVHELNKHLPFRLGISIRDSCWSERIAMEQTIAFLREGVTQCSCCQTAGCQKKANPVVAVVGPAKSSTNIAVQNLLQVFRIPQIGYSATTTDLSDKEQFGYYLRVVPSDVWQARAINELLQHFNWTYIAVVYSSGNYGEKGYEALERLTHSAEIVVCISHTHKVKSLAPIKDFENVLNSLLNLSLRPQVVVCFCEGLSMKKIFQAQQNLRKKNPNLHFFQWIGSDGWADRLDVVEGVEDEAAGSFSIRIHSPRVENFESYYFSLNPFNYTVNPWFRELWQEKFKCQLTVPKDDSVTRVCTGKENLTLNYEQDPKLSQVINAVRVVGFALKAMYNDKCRNYNSYQAIKNLSYSNNEKKMETINGTLLYKYMINVSFKDQYEQEISFDENGDPPAWYDILNYIGFKGYELAGDFLQPRGGAPTLRINKSPKLFYDKSSVLPESVCSKPCTVGQRKRQTNVCCWICEACQPVQIVNFTTNKCQNCPFGYWPAKNRTNCFPLSHEYHSLYSGSSIIAFSFSIFGIFLTLLVIIVFINYGSTPVVKSTTRELSFIILSGICACYICTFIILARPSFITCFMTRTLPPIAFSIIYSALLTKTNRIARILAGSKKRILTKKPRFLSTFSQVVITWILVGVQCVIVAVGVIEEMPEAGFESHFMPQRMVLICTSSNLAFMIPFVWNFLLVLSCTIYAFKTRNLPENFNEAKFIGFTMYCTLVVWAAFVVLYLNAVNKALTMSFTFSISASITLVLLFFPKLYIILFHPEKNVRSLYTTTKLIRCHFGNSQGNNEIKHLSSKTQVSLQSSCSASYPTRTASLHVVNHLVPSEAHNSSLPIALALGGNFSSYDAGSPTNIESNSACQDQSHFCNKHFIKDNREIGTQTNESLLSFFTINAEKPIMPISSPINKSYLINKMKNSNEILSKQKKSDEDMSQLISSYCHYQEEKNNLVFQTQNYLLEKKKINENENFEIHYPQISQMLAGTIERGMRTVFSTVSKTAPKISILNIKQKFCTENNGHLSTLSSSLPPLSSILLRDYLSLDNKNKFINSSENEKTNETKQNKQQFVDDIFEMLLRSRGIKSVQLSSATQL